MDITAQKKWLIYILECRDGSFYCGITNNLEKRLKQHKGEIKGGAKYTRTHWPCKLVYEEKSVSRSDALKRELIIKKMSKVEKQTLINSFKEDSSQIMVFRLLFGGLQGHLKPSLSGFLDLQIDIF